MSENQSKLSLVSRVRFGAIGAGKPCPCVSQPFSASTVSFDTGLESRPVAIRDIGSPLWEQLSRQQNSMSGGNEWISQTVRRAYLDELRHPPYFTGTSFDRVCRHHA
jgi:hypothetical protein